MHNDIGLYIYCVNKMAKTYSKIKRVNFIFTYGKFWMYNLFIL